MSYLPRTLPHCLAAAACLAGLAMFVLPAQGDVAPDTWRVAGIVVACIGLWATAALPEYFVAIIFIVLAITLTDADRGVVLSGFQSSATWMVFGGLIIALAVQTTGLGARIADAILARAGRSYFGVLCGTVAVAASSTFLIPSNTGRILILLPIFLALADRLGFEEGSNGRAGIALAVGAGSFYPSMAVLPAAVPNLVMIGAAESIHGLHLTYGEYLLLQFPVIGVVTILILPPVLAWLFPDTSRGRGKTHAGAPLGGAERRLIVVLAVTLVLWITDFAHGVAPAWVALAAAVVCMLPRIGMLEPSAMVSRINLAPWFFVAGIIGMGAVVAKSGLGNVIGNGLLSLIPMAPGNDFANLAALSAIVTATGWIATIPGAPAVLTSFAGNIADAAGWPLKTAILAQVLGWSLTLFPYQLPPMVVTIQLGGVSFGQATRLLVTVAVIGWLVMLPLQYLWWRTLGMFAGINT